MLATNMKWSQIRQNYMCCSYGHRYGVVTNTAELYAVVMARDVGHKYSSSINTICPIHLSDWLISILLYYVEL